MPSTNYFYQCITLDEVKKLYRELCKVNHPDKGGDLETMQAINSQYSKAIKMIAAGQNLNSEDLEAEILSAEAYQAAVNKTVHLEGITLELVGSWLWITGNTRQHKDILKTEPAKFTWAKKKDDFSAWFFRTSEHKAPNKGSKKSLDDIRNKYGSQQITGKGFKSNFINA